MRKRTPAPSIANFKISTDAWVDFKELCKRQQTDSSSKLRNFVFSELEGTDEQTKTFKQNLDSLPEELRPILADISPLEISEKQLGWLAAYFGLASYKTLCEIELLTTDLVQTTLAISANVSGMPYSDWEPTKKELEGTMLRLKNRIKEEDKQSKKMLGALLEGLRSTK